MADDSGRPADGTAKPVIFISYSHKDEPEKPGPDEVAWLTFVQSFLAPAVKQGLFDIFGAEQISAGAAFDLLIESKLRACDIFILLVSANSMASGYIEKEISIIRERQALGEAVYFFPLILTPTSGAGLEKIAEMNLRPRDGRALSSFSRFERESEMSRIADEIADIARKIAVRKNADKSSSDNKPEIDQRVYAPDFAADRADGKQDALDITSDVDAFAQLICLKSTNPPLSIALFGSWGSGKTFFMERLLERVADLTARAQIENAATPETSNFTHRIIERVVQVRFNAWHYSDANLWASLTAEFFDQLRAGGAGQKRAATYESLVDQVARHVPILEADASVKAEAVVELDRQLSDARRAVEETRRRLDSAEKSAFAKAAGSALEKSFNEHRDQLQELGRRVYMDDLAGNITSFTNATREAVTIPGKLRLIYRFLRSDTPAAWVAWVGLVLLLTILVALPFADMTVMAVRIGQVQQWSIFPVVVTIATASWRGYVFFKPVLEGAAAFSKDASAAREGLAATLVAREAEVSALARKLENAKGQSDTAKDKLARNAGNGDARAGCCASLLALRFQRN